MVFNASCLPLRRFQPPLAAAHTAISTMFSGKPPSLAGDCFQNRPASIGPYPRPSPLRLLLFWPAYQHAAGLFLSARDMAASRQLDLQVIGQPNEANPSPI